MVTCRVAVALLLILFVLIGSCVSVATRHVYYGVDGFVVDGYGNPLLLYFRTSDPVPNDTYLLYVYRRPANISTYSYYDYDLRGWMNYSNVVGFDIFFDGERGSVSWNVDDYIIVRVWSGLVDIVVVMDRGGGSPNIYGNYWDTLYDDIEVYVNGVLVYNYTGKVTLQRMVFYTLDERFMRNVLSIGVKTYDGGIHYHCISYELPAPVNLSIYRLGVDIPENYVSRTFLPSFTVHVANGSTATNYVLYRLHYNYYCRYFGNTTSCRYSPTNPPRWDPVWSTCLDKPYPIIYNGTTLYINASRPVAIMDNISITEYLMNQIPIPEIKVYVDPQVYRTWDNKLHYRIRLNTPLNNTRAIVVKIETTGEFEVVGYGRYVDEALITINMTGEGFEAAHVNPLDILPPVAYADEPGATLEIISENPVTLTIVKVVTDSGEYIINQTITLGGKAISYVQSLWDNYGLLLVAVPVLFILLLLALARAGRGRR